MIYDTVNWIIYFNFSQEKTAFYRKQRASQSWLLFILSRSLIHWIVSFLSVVVFLLLLQIPAAANASTAQALKISPENLEKIYTKIQSEGQARVIVELQSPAEPYAKLIGNKAKSRKTQNLRRAAIKRLQNRLLRVLNPRSSLNFTHIPYMALTVDKSELERLTGLPEVMSIREDRLLRPLLNNSVPQIHADLSWTKGYSGAGQVIAVLDTGMDSEHGALAGKVVGEACFSTNSSSDNASSLCPNGTGMEIGSGAAINCTGISGCDHGTHVAGIAAADDNLYAGVARDADLMAVQVFSRLDNFIACGFMSFTCLAAYTSDIIRGLEYVYDQKDSFNIAAVNMSLGGQSYGSAQECDAAEPALKGAIDNLRAVGIATVIASGNNGYSNAISSPGCISSAISVGAVTGSDGVASFSNSSTWLKSLAPGTNIDSAVPGGNFAAKDGTSMAAPHVAGAVAVLNSAVNEATVDEIEDVLTGTGVMITDYRNGAEIPRIQVDAATQALIGVYDISTINLELEQVISGLDKPVAIAHAADNSGRLFIAQKPGQIEIHDGVSLLSTPFLDISSFIFPLTTDNREGLLSVAFHPNYASNGYFFLSYINPDHEVIVARYRVSSSDANQADENSRLVLLTIPILPGAADGNYHYGGHLAFGSDGYLYIATGDGSEDNVVVNTARNLGTLLGKILRIDVDTGSPYAIPPDNPFVLVGDALDEIWASGLRNPWRFSFDPLTGDMYLADVGEDSFEEVNYQDTSSSGGEDYGWSVMEGAQCYGADTCNTAGLVLPTAVYDHSEGCAVTGGQVYRGQKYPLLRGVYLYADYCSGKLWGLKQNGSEWQSALMLDTAPSSISTFGAGEDGDIYLADHAAGSIYRVKVSLSVRTTDLPEGQVGESYNTTLRASGGQAPYVWSISAGSLPDGLTLDLNTGSISGVTGTYGLSTFTVQVQDANLATGTENLSITINPEPLTIQTVSLQDAQFNQNYNQILQANGGMPPYNWSIVSGVLPPGLSLYPNGTISGTPTQQWKYTFTVEVSATGGVKDSRSLAIFVVGPSGAIEIPLLLGIMDTGEYGYNYGSNLHEAELTATFDSPEQDLLFSVTGYDIDYADEVAVYLNDNLLGYLSTGPNDGLNAGDVFLIPASAQLADENRIKFVQKTVGWIWGVTNLIVEIGNLDPPEVALTVDVPDNGEYGYSYGSNQHEKELIATFEGATVDLVFSVTGYDIDYADEVAVYLNDNLLGYLSTGLNNGLNAGDVFLIPASAQLADENRIKFVQKTVGWIWGLTHLLLAEYAAPPADITLTPEVMDAGEYGYGYGSSQYATELTVGFESMSVDLYFSVTGYDIDFTDELAVYLNDNFLGYLSTGPNNVLNSGDSFLIPASSQIAGENRIKFVQKTVGWIWGVTNLLISENNNLSSTDITLTYGVIDTGQYGNGYGSDQNPTELTVDFEGTTTDVFFSVTGFDIDYTDELAVYLNDNFIGYLSRGPNNGLNAGDSFLIPASNQLNGENRIKFVLKTAGWIWGVTNLLAADYRLPLPDVTLSIGVTDTGEYGYKYGSNQHINGLTVDFTGTSGDLLFTVTGYDIDYSDEIGVYLNDNFLGYLRRGPNNGLSAGDSFAIPAGDQISGENRIKFVQKKPGWIWGITNLMVAEGS
jgi:subtilisin family serine protease